MTSDRRRAQRGMRHLYALDRRRDRRPLAYLAILVAALLALRLVSLVVVYEPGYTDAYYFASVASRLARGDGLTADFIWNYLEAPHLAALPIASHRFWMPLSTLVQAAGIVVAGGALGDFRAGQLALVAVAAAIPAVTYAAARALGAGVLAALAAAAVAGLGGAFAPGWVSADAFALAAVLGTSFFIAFAAAARGSVRAGALAGLFVGLLYLARAEGALFGLALLWLAGRRSTRRAGIAGSAVALAIGVAWLVRGIALSFPSDLAARSMLLVRYQDFFALQAPTFDAFAAALPEVLGAKIAALATNAVTAVMVVLLVPLAAVALEARRAWARPEVRAFTAILAAVYLAQSLLFTPHSVRGSFFHAAAAFFPYAIALAAAGADRFFSASTPGVRRTVWASTVVGFGIVSVFALGQWDVDFNSPYRARLAAAEQLPPGPLMAADAAAWRWISGREAVLAPADGPDAAACVAEVYLARTLVLEPAHFTTYDALYAAPRAGAFSLVRDLGGIRVYAASEQTRCITAAEP